MVAVSAPAVNVSRADAAVSAGAETCALKPSRLATTTNSGLLADHDQVLRVAVESHGGWLFKHTGDGVCAAFSTATDAVTAAIGAQFLPPSRISTQQGHPAHPLTGNPSDLAGSWQLRCGTALLRKCVVMCPDVPLEGKGRGVVVAPGLRRRQCVAC